MRPVRLAPGDPGQSIGGAALHLHHVRHGVMGPAVARVGLDRGASGFLGRGIGAGFLEAEGVHAQNDGPSGHLGPMRQGSGDAVAQGPRVRPQEIDEMPRLQRDQVPGEAERVPFEPLRRFGPVAPERGLKRREMPGLPFASRAPRDAGERGARRGGGLRFRGEGETPAPRDGRHEAVGRLGRGRVEQTHGVARVGGKGLAAGIEEVARGGRGTGKRVGVTIEDLMHGLPFLLRCPSAPEPSGRFGAGGLVSAG